MRLGKKAHARGVRRRKWGIRLRNERGRDDQGSWQVIPVTVHGGKSCGEGRKGKKKSD